MDGLRINEISVIIILIGLIHLISSDEYCKVRSSKLSPDSDLKFTMMLSLRKDQLNDGCGQISDEALHNYVAVKWILEKVNSENGSFIPGVKIGFQLYDDCRSKKIAARNAISLINSDLPYAVTDCQNSSVSVPNIGIIGPSRSTTAEIVSELLNDTDIPIISPSATMDGFSNKTLHPNVFRTAPSDSHQVEAIIQILKQFHWSYVAVVYSSDPYGQRGKEMLQERTKQEKICIAVALAIEQDNLAHIVSELRSTSFNAQDNTLAVIYFGQKDTAENLMFYVHSIIEDKTRNFRWIMSEAVGQNRDVFATNKKIVTNALTLSPSTTQMPEFLEFYSKHLEDVKNNIIQDSYIAEYLTQSAVSVQYSRHNDYVPLTIDAVFALLISLKDAYTRRCPEQQAVCSNLKSDIAKGKFIDYVRNVVVDYSTIDQKFLPESYKNKKREFRFSETGDVTPLSVSYLVNSFISSTKSFDQVGNFTDGVLYLDKPRIKFQAADGSEVTGLNPPNSACFKHCKNCIDDSKTPMILIEGDVYIVGIFSLHERDPDGRFGCDGFRNVSSDTVLLEGFLHAVEKAKANTGINFGAIAFDDCYNPLKIATTLSTYFSGFEATKGMFAKIIPWNNVVSVIGPLSSGVTIPVAEFFSPLNIPVVSYAASSPDLDDRTNFPYFIRTVPSDKDQAEAMVAVIQSMGWEYVDILYVANNYGTKGKDQFIKVAAENGVCVGEPMPISETNADEPALYKTVLELKNRQAKIVVFFGIDTRYSDVIKILNSGQDYGDFIFLASEEWGTKQQLLVDGGKAARGTLTLDLASPQVETLEFQRYMLERNLENTLYNPWFSEFWQHLFKCNIKGNFNNVFDTQCSQSLRLTEDNLGEHLEDQRLAHVRSAVLAVTESMKKTKADICNDGPFPCNFFYDPKYSSMVLENIRNIELKTKASDSYFRLFDDNGNGELGFKIYNIQQNSELVYEEVGYYNNRGLTLHKDRLKFYNELGDLLTNVQSGCENNRCEKCERKVVPSVSPSPSASAPLLDERFRIPDIILIILVGVLLVALIVIILATCSYFRKKVEALTKHVQAVENSHMYEPIREGIPYQNRQFDRARYHPGQETIKFVNPSLNSIGSLNNIGINNQAFIHDDHYLHANGSILSQSPQGGILGSLTPGSISPVKPDLTQQTNPRLSGLSSPTRSIQRPTSHTLSSPLSQYIGDQMYMEDPNRHGSMIGNGHVPTIQQASRAFHLPIQVPYTQSNQHTPEEQVEYSDVITPPENHDRSPASHQQTLSSPNHSDRSSQTAGTPYEMSPTASFQSISLSSNPHQSPQRISPSESDPHTILRQRNIDKIPKPPRQNQPPLPQRVSSELPVLHQHTPEPMNDVNSPVLSRKAHQSPIPHRNIGQQGISVISSGVPYSPSRDSQMMNISLESPQVSEHGVSGAVGGVEARISRV